MGLFSKLKNKNSKPMDNDSVYKEIFSMISDNDEKAMAEITECLEKPRLYARDNYDVFDTKGLVPTTVSDFKVKWLGCIQIMIKYGYAREFGAKIDFDDFYKQFGELKIVSERGIIPPEDEIYLDYEINSWISCIEHFWGKSGMCVGEFDINSILSDDYKGRSRTVFVCTVEQLEKLSRLADDAGRKIDRA